MKSVLVVNLPYETIDPRTLEYHDGKDMRLNYDSLPKIENLNSFVHEFVEADYTVAASELIYLYAKAEASERF